MEFVNVGDKFFFDFNDNVTRLEGGFGGDAARFDIVNFDACLDRKIEERLDETADGSGGSCYS